MNDLILLTRKVGVTVEGYFQYFGRFSPRDGVRRLDLDQFMEACSSLPGLTWRRDEGAIQGLFESLVIGANEPAL